MSKASKNHHYVPRAQLRHFSIDKQEKRVWVFDKENGRAWPSAIAGAGSENNFNTVELDTGRWNFEDLFNDVDARSAAVVRQVVDSRSLGWVQPEDHLALLDLFATQMLRTHLARTSPRSLAEKMRELVRLVGYDPDHDPDMAIPTEATLRIDAVRRFLERGELVAPMARLRPALFAPRQSERFVLSDHPVIVSNAYCYGDAALQSHGVIVFLPLAPDLAAVLICPTIIARHESIERANLPQDRRARMERYRAGFRAGEPITIESSEVENWNRLQVAYSRRYLYGSIDDFDFARVILAENPSLRRVETHVSMGEMGAGPPRRQGMPPGLQLVVQGQHDSCVLAIEEVDEFGEALTVRTDSLALLQQVAADSGELRVELYDDGSLRRGMAAVRVEPIQKPESGWFRVVHRDEGLRELARKTDPIRPTSDGNRDR
ncbi:hypothetical protein AMC87_PB00108 (plasmid) [Rhizobium phaseoli]|uniref:DUF4238 domain-containing protein n=1 Tax=Rhizobium phaseoli TaxID=396 RepID=UPI0007EAF294|nr:DUF4238 domain-containing protein [Rhizobium phaseoli]ANL49432.1 hypothetical protein AMC87_PB00108 [Rhizobium phaseoli]